MLPITTDKGTGGARTADLSCEHPVPDLKTYLRHILPGDLGSCLVIAVLVSLLIGPFIGGESTTWWSILVFNTIVSLCIGLTVANTFRFVLPLLRRRFGGRVADISLHVVLGFGATALGVEIAIRLIETLGGMSAAGMRGSVLRVGLVVVAVAIAIDVTYERLRRRARRDEMRAEQAHKETLRAQLKALQARTNPHFLFNSLNTVSGLIEEDPAGAERILGRLSELFRYALKSSDAGWVRLEEEVAAVENYLEVEAIRLGERLRTTIDVPARLRETLVPPLLLQPLVENAVLHGVAPRKAGGRIEIAARQVNGRLHLTVTDNGDGPGSSPHQGSGTSLVEMADRLRLIYGEGASLEAGIRADEADGQSPEARGRGYRVTVSLPRETPA